MNFQTAAIAASAAFLLSFLSGLIGGVPLFDIFLRALIWGLVGFGGSLGIETLLRSLVPDLFAPSEEPVPREEPGRGQAVNITLEEEVPRSGGFVEEVDEEEPVAPSRRSALEPQEEEPSERPSSAPAPVAPAESAGAGDSGDEEMPEIGSFLDAFKPESPENGEASAASEATPSYGEYSPDSSRSSSPSGEVTIDGEAQDPVILAKAVQTVMKRDAQGN